MENGTRTPQSQVRPRIGNRTSTAFTAALKHKKAPKIRTGRSDMENTLFYYNHAYIWSHTHTLLLAALADFYTGEDRFRGSFPAQQELLLILTL